MVWRLGSGPCSSGRIEDDMVDVGGIAGDQLRSYIERIERLEEEKAALAADIRDVFAEAKGNGFDVKIMRQVLQLRKMDKDSTEEGRVGKECVRTWRYRWSPVH